MRKKETQKKLSGSEMEDFFQLLVILSFPEVTTVCSAKNVSSMDTFSQN